jgi:hypothetical protein
LGSRRQYDSLSRTTYSGFLTSTRHHYYTDSWQVVEERLNTSLSADRQFVWGKRYVDDLVLRDRDTTGGGTLNERMYGMQDANWNLTVIADSSGNVQERYGYSDIVATSVAWSATSNAGWLR